MKQNSFKIGAYVRVSTEEQAENPEGSIKNQELRLRDYVKLKNHDGHFGEITEVYIDPGISAKDMNRPSLQRLLNKIKAKEINLVLVTELSRLTRSTKDFSLLWEFMNEHDCKFLSLRDNFDSTTPAGEMIMFTLANFAQFERRQTGERIANSFLARSKRGLWNGGILPLGFDVDSEKPGHLKIIESEAEIVREVFKAFLKEETISRAAKSLNDRNIQLPRKMRRGGSVRSHVFKIDNTHNVLTNAAYIGVRKYKTKDGVQLTQAAWPAIVDELTFERVQRLLKANHSRRKPPSVTRFPYTLSGVLFCKTCGDRLCGKSAHGRVAKIAYYEHAWSTKTQSCLSKKIFSCDPNRILAYKIEPVVWNDVKNILQSEAYAKAMFTEAKTKYTGADSKAKEHEKLKTKITSLQNQIEATTERITELPKGIDAKAFYDQILKLQDHKVGFENQLQALKSEAIYQDQVIEFEDFQKFTESLRQLAEKCTDPNLQAAIIRKIVAKIEVTPNSVVIHYNVGETYYRRELGDQQALAPISPRPAMPETKGEATNKKGLVDFTRPHTKPLPKYFSNACSNSLISGAPVRT